MLTEAATIHWRYKNPIIIIYNNKERLNPPRKYNFGK